MNTSAIIITMHSFLPFLTKETVYSDFNCNEGSRQTSTDVLYLYLYLCTQFPCKTKATGIRGESEFTATLASGLSFTLVFSYSAISLPACCKPGMSALPPFLFCRQWKQASLWKFSPSCKLTKAWFSKTHSQSVDHYLFTKALRLGALWKKRKKNSWYSIRFFPRLLNEVSLRLPQTNAFYCV